jgi:predicted RNA methylase
MPDKDRVFYNLRTHLEMLRDRVRCLAFQQALESVVREKTVLDVGCGSGILSLFAARAGAKQVFAVDMDVPPAAEDVAQANGLADRVQFIRGRIEDAALPVDSVDIIVSEWMGGLLLMEDMLPAVLHARDRWLKPGGLMLPDRARLFLAPLKEVAHISSNDYPTLRQTVSSQMWVSAIDPSRFLAEPACILDIDLTDAQASAAREYEAAFRFGVDKPGTFEGFGLWFDVHFSKTRPSQWLSTAPWLPPTHWAQVLWVLPVDTEVKTGDTVSGTFAQTKITASNAFFKADIKVKTGVREKKTFNQTMQASAATMNPGGSIEDHLAAQAMSGVFRGLDCLWLGCSMSMGALAAARNGARSVTVLNRSPWAALAMQQFAAQEGLTNVFFLSELPPGALLQQQNPCLLGAADSSWQSLLDHIRVRRALGRASFTVRFCRQESPWTYFYGFDFSAYAGHDLDMYHEDLPLTDGLALNDITCKTASNGAAIKEEEVVYRGARVNGSHAPIYLADGSYNSIKVGFECGTVGLPLQEPLKIDSSRGILLHRVELAVSVINSALCRFTLMLSGPGQSYRQSYEQPIAAMGHIVRNPQGGY